jgi:uncharacterized repeat protein (TIGR01451 family)
MQLSMPQLCPCRFGRALLLLALVFGGANAPQAHTALAAPSGSREGRVQAGDRSDARLLVKPAPGAVFDSALATLRSQAERKLSPDDLSSSASPAASFTARVVPRILLVDDDTNDPDVRPYFTNALDALSVAYDIFDTTTSAKEPDSAALANYVTVIWATGRNGYPDLGAETALADFLDHGHCLFVSSQEYLYNRGSLPTPFMQQYLGVGSAADDTFQTIVSGVGPVFSGIGPAVLATPMLYENRADRISPDATAMLAFSGNNPLQVDSAVEKDAGRYRTTYWGFGFESLPSAAMRQEAMQRVVNWCDFQADLSIRQTISPASTLRPGQPLTYTLSYKNDGVAIASGVLLTDTLPAALGSLNVTSSGPTISALAGAPYRWKIADIAPGASGTITITGVVDPGLTADVVGANVATLTTTAFDSSSTNNSVQTAFNVVAPRLAFSGAAYSVTENSGAALITMTLDAPNPFAGASVAYATSDGSAQAGSDYTAHSGIATIAAGQASVSFGVPIIDDGVPEGGETVLLSLSSPSGAQLAVPSSATLTILANDGIAPPKFTSPLPAEAKRDLAYSHQFTASGLPQPSFTLTGGALPPGLALSADGLLSGTPTQAGTYAGISVTASNGMAPDATQTFSIVVSAHGSQLFLPMIVR